MVKKDFFYTIFKNIFYKFSLNIRYTAQQIIMVSGVAYLLSSCVNVKNAPNKPFVFDNKVIIKDTKISSDERKRLERNLALHWDDSAVAKIVMQFMGLRTVIKKPPVYDSVNVARSKVFMNSYLKSQGYYYADFKDSVYASQKNKQQRITAVMLIHLGKNVTIDSVSYELENVALQKIAEAQLPESIIKKGSPYSKQIISAELDRLTSIFKQKGYYDFTKDDLYALVDTTDKRLLELTFDPAEQARLLAAFEKARKEDPKWNVAIMLKPDTLGKLKPYYIGKTYYYTQAEMYDIADSVIQKKWDKSYVGKGFEQLYTVQNISHRPLRNFTYLNNGNLYSEANYFKTINSLNKLGVFKQVDAKIIKRDNDTLDFHYILVPEKKFNIENRAELSRNSGDITSGNLMGISANISFRNRNLFKQAIQSLTSARLGVEFSLTDTTKALQTLLASVNQTFSIPRIFGQRVLKQIALFKPLSKPINSMLNSENNRTFIGFTGSYNDRFNVFKLRSLVANAGWEWKNGNNIWQLKPLNIELYELQSKPGLEELLAKNPFLQLAFNTGNVLGSGFSFFNNHNSKKRPNVSHFVRIAGEESGTIWALYKPFRKNIYQYLKLEAEYRQSIKYTKTEFTFRLFGGAGYNYAKQDEIGLVMPFFKQFALGGPNSMRAWSVRQLGQGSSLLSDTTKSGFKERFGDMALEGNVEYRFLLYDNGFLRLGSALFADIGNIWNLRDFTEDNNAVFNPKRMYKDMAVGVGTGIRLDISSYITLRLDAGYKLKDPARPYNDGWINVKNFGLKETRPNGVEVRNFAIQVGLGMPF